MGHVVVYFRSLRRLFESGAPTRADSLRCRRYRGRADVLSVRDDRAQEPVRDLSHPVSYRWSWTESVAPESVYGDSPALALHGVRGDDHSVRICDSRVNYRPFGRFVATCGAPLDHDGLALSLAWSDAWHDLGVRRTGLGRVLGLGPGGERRAAALVYCYRVLTLCDGAGAAKHAAGLEHDPDHFDLLSHHFWYVHDPLWHRTVSPRVWAGHGARRDVHCLYGGAARGQLRLSDLPVATVEGS